MVLGEFTEEEQEIIFSDKNLKSFLINEIIKKGVEEAEDVIINLALEYLLEQLENPDKEEDNETFISGIKQVYLMANYDFIKNNLNYSFDVPDNVKECYEEYLAKPSDNPKLTFNEFEINYYNTFKTKNILNNANVELKAKQEELIYLTDRIANIELKLEELQEELK